MNDLDPVIARLTERLNEADGPRARDTVVRAVSVACMAARSARAVTNGGAVRIEDLAYHDVRSRLWSAVEATYCPPGVTPPSGMVYRDFAVRESDLFTYATEVARLAPIVAAALDDALRAAG